MKCTSCEKEYDPIEVQDHPLKVCSVDCLRALNVKYAPISLKMVHQKGMGKFHSHPVETKRKKKK